MAGDASMTTPWQAFLACLRDCGVEAKLTHHAALCAALTVENEPPRLSAYFQDVPAHSAALRTLDHTQFLSNIPAVPCEFPLRAVLDAFSGCGPVLYGRVWLALLDLAAAAAGGENPDIQAARTYVHRMMAPGSTAADAGAAELDQAVNMLVGSVPGLQDTLQHILGTSTSGASFLDAMVDRVQGMLTSGGGLDVPANLQPAVSQILQGFRTLSQALGQETGM